MVGRTDLACFPEGLYRSTWVPSLCRERASNQSVQFGVRANTGMCGAYLVVGRVGTDVVDACLRRNRTIGFGVDRGQPACSCPKLSS